MNGIFIAADQMVIGRQGLTGQEQLISAGLGHPFDLGDGLWGQRDAIGDMCLALGVIGASARFAIEQAAMQPRIGDVAAVFVLKLEQAAFRAAIADGFPFFGRHLFERFGFPERVGHSAPVYRVNCALASHACAGYLVGMEKRRLPSSPALDWKPDGTPVSETVGDVYFSVEDGLEEARSVFLAGCGLPDRWQGRDRFTIAELGFGTGLNFLAAWQMWRETRPSPEARLDFVSFEGYPLDAASARRALARWPELSGLADALLDKWPERMRGVQRIGFGDGVTLILHIDEIADALPRSRFYADAWFLDGFSPAKNTEMWDEALYPLMFARSTKGARIGTYTVAGAVRRGLSAAGFSVSKAPGFGRKRERLEAVCEELPERAPDVYGLAALAAAPERVAIVGAGIAGACAARACTEQGALVTVYEQAGEIGSGASGNPLALVMPRLDVSDTVVARASLEAYQAARHLYAGRPGVASVDCSQRPRGQADQAKFEKLLADPPLGADRLGADVDGGLIHKAALMLRPEALLVDLLEGVEIKLGTEAKLDLAGRRVNGASYDAIVLANGMGVSGLEETSWLPITGRLGQVEFCQAAESRLSAIASGHYALADGRMRLWGASFESYEGGRLDASASAKASNAAALEGLGYGDWLANEGIESRVGVRATTPDKLPICGALPDVSQAMEVFAAVRKGQRVERDMLRHDGVFCLAGLGSRGFGFAPLLADILASRLFGGALPVEQDVAEALSPVRFLLRGLKRGQI